MRERIFRWSIITIALLTAVILSFINHNVSAANMGGAGQSRTEASADYPLPPGAAAELQRIRAQIDRIEAQTLQLQNTDLDSMHQIQTLGKLELFDTTLSVNQNEACSTCHMPQVGYTGASQVLNSTTVAYPGSVEGRFSPRKPMSYTYATDRKSVV